jgi:hypothetical protein
VRRTAHTATAIARAKKDSRTDLEPLYRAHAEARIADFVERTLATAPPLSEDQVDRLVATLTAPRR